MASHEPAAIGTDGEFSLAQEEDRNRWAVRTGEDVVGALTYQFAGGRYVLISTHVDDAYRHRGLARALVRRALDDIAGTGRKITVICPFVGDVIAQHPKYFDLVDPVHPGSGITGTPGRAPEPSEAPPAVPATATRREDAVGERTARIMVLGAIAYRGPLTVAGIVQVLQEWGVERWALIPAETIDREVRVLAEAGFIRRGESADAGDPAFQCTEEGRSELRRHLLGVLNAESFPPFSLLPLLHFVNALSVEELADGLRRRILVIDEVLAHESSVISRAPADGPDHASEIVRVNWHRYNADRAWSLEFFGRLYGAPKDDAPTF